MSSVYANTNIRVLLLLIASLAFALIPSISFAASLSASPNPFTLSNTIIDVGQYSFANTIVSGGSGTIIGNWSWSMDGASSGNVIGSTGTQVWHTTNSLAVAEVYPSCSAYNGYLYCMGGYSSGASSIVQSAQIYSGTNVIGSWQTTNSLAVAEDYFSCAVYNGYLYCMGGDNGGASSIVQSAQIYSGTNVIGAWHTTNSLAVAEAELSCSAYNSYLYCMGGYTTDIVQSAQIYSGTNVIGAWHTTNSLAVAEGLFSCSAYSGYLYCMGGSSGSSSSIVQSAQIYSGTNVIGSWQTTNSLAVAEAEHSCSAYNSYLYCMGGNSAAYIVQSAQIYSGTNVIGVWHTTNSLATAQAEHSCSAYNSYLYCMGGDLGGSIVQSANILTQEVTYLQPTASVTSGLALTINPTSSTSATMTYFGNTITVTASGTNTIYGAWTFNGFAQDGTADNALISTNTLTIDPALATPTVSSSNTLIDPGQYVNFAAYETGGTLPYTYNFIVYNSVTNIQVANMLTSSNSFLWQATGNAGNTIVANVFVTDHASTPITVNSLQTSSITINSVLATPIITSPSNSIVDVGQYETFNAVVSGSSSTFTYNFLIVNSINTAIWHGYNGLAYNGITFQIISANDIGNSPEEANVIVTDSNGNSGNSIYSSTFTINPTINAPTIQASNTPAIDVNQYVRFSAYETGGAAPYTYNFIVFNTITNVMIANSLTTSNSFIVGFSTAQTVAANVIVTDSATSNEIANSINTPTITVNSVLAIPTISASNTLVDAGQYVNFAAYETGGTLPYTYNFIVYNSVTNIQVANMLTSSNSFLWQATGNAGNTIVANVFVTDHASTSVTMNSIHTSQIVAYSTPVVSLTVQTGSGIATNSILYGNSVITTVFVTCGTE